jgi:hypothetical protein
MRNLVGDRLGFGLLDGFWFDLGTVALIFGRGLKGKDKEGVWGFFRIMIINDHPPFFNSFVK